MVFKHSTTAASFSYQRDNVICLPSFKHLILVIQTLESYLMIYYSQYYGISDKFLSLPAKIKRIQFRAITAATTEATCCGKHCDTSSTTRNALRCGSQNKETNGSIANLLVAKHSLCS
jgi:hypothetical protein